MMIISDKMVVVEILGGGGGTEDHAASLDDAEGQRKQRMNCKLACAKEFLGSHHVLHPAYRPQDNLQHSVHHKTSAVLSPVADRAKWCGRLQ